MNNNIFAEDFSEQPLWWCDVAPVSISGSAKSAESDVTVVGSGYAGLSCALRLAQQGMSVTVLEAEKCGFGASTRNAGFLSGRAGVSKQINLEAAVGKDRATRILDEADAAYDSLKSLVAENRIDCNLAEVGRFVGAHTPAAFEKLAAKTAEYRGGDEHQRNFHTVTRAEQHRYVDSDYWYGGMFTDEAGLIHPSRYHKGLRNLCEDAGVSIVSGARVVGIATEENKKHVETTTGTFRSREVVLATNGYTDGLSPWHQKRLIPVSSTIVASEELGEERVNTMLPWGCPVIDTKRVVCFARPSPDHKRILFGGRARFSPLGGEQSAQILHHQLVQMFPQMQDIKVTNTWSGMMAFTFDFLPKVGVHDGIHYALGCNAGCGIVMMSWLGKQAAENILGTANAPSAFAGLPFQTQAFYAGKPWFLPVVGNWWRMRDWWEIKRAKRAMTNAGATGISGTT